MSFGWVDPDSVRMDDARNIVGEFYRANDAKRLVLQVPAVSANRLDSLLEAQGTHGVVFLDAQIEELNAAETVRGTIRAENRTAGDAELLDGRKVSAEFPQGTFDEPGYYKFRGTGVVDSGTLQVFAADTIVTEGPLHNPGL